MPVHESSRAAQHRQWLLTALYFIAVLAVVEGVIWIAAVTRAAEDIPVRRGRMPAHDSRIEPNRIDAFITSNMQRTGVPGVAIAMVKGNGVAYTAGYGVTPTGAVIDSATPMPIASLSKSFTATAVMRLVKNGRLSLDGNLSQTLPHLVWADARVRAVTIGQLLNQSSGIVCDDPAVRAANTSHSLAQALEHLQSMFLAAEPGVQWRYCNANYHLLAAIVERATSQLFAAYLDDTVFTPLGLSSTSVMTRLREDPSTAGQGFALVYGFPLRRRLPDELGLGAGGMKSSADDLARWLLLQLSEGSADGSLADLSVASSSAMGARLAPDSNYAFGWRRDTLQGKEYRFHSGRMLIYSAHQAVLPEAGYAYAIVWNSLHPLGAEQRSFINGLNAILLDQAPVLGQSVGRIVDSVLAGFTILWIFIGIVGVATAHPWAQREWSKPYLRPAASMVAYTLIALLVFALPMWSSAALGQNLSLPLLFEIWPAVGVLLATTGLASLSIAAMRVVRIRAAATTAQ